MYKKNSKIIIIILLNLFILNVLYGEDYVPINKKIETNFEYRIGSHDVLQINVWGYDNLKEKVTVRSDGMITYEMVGDIHASDLTPTQLSEKISQKLSGYLRDPKVIVKVLQIKSQKVTIIGDIPTPGSYYLSGPTRLLDILTKSGWNPMKSEAKEVTIMRKNGQIIKINLEELLFKGNPAQNVYIKSGDTLLLPKPVIGQVYVEGEVGKPGKYKLIKGEKMLVSSLLEKAGKLKSSADLKRVKIVRNNGQEILLNLEYLKYMADEKQNYVLYSGDRLVIPRIRETKIYVFGEVERRGIVRINDPMPTILKLLTQAGDKYFAVLSNVKVVRNNPMNPGHPIVFNIDLKKVLYLHDSSQNIKLENYDVVYLPQSFLGSFAKFLDEVWPSIIQGAGAVSDIKDMRDGKWDSFGSGDNNNRNR